MFWYQKLAKIATPFDEDIYKVVLSLDALQPVLGEHVVSPSLTLESLTISSESDRIFLHGLYKLLDDSMLRSLGYDKIIFRAECAVRDSKDNDVVLRVAKLRLHDPAGPAIDMLHLASKLVRSVRRRIIKAITDRVPHILSPRSNFAEVVFHTNYFLARVPSFSGSLGEIKLLHVRPISGNHVNFFVHSNLVMMNLVQAFGPQFLQLEEIQATQEQDSQKFLWDLFRGE